MNNQTSIRDKNKSLDRNQGTRSSSFQRKNNPARNGLNNEGSQVRQGMKTIQSQVSNLKSDKKLALKSLKVMVEESFEDHDVWKKVDDIIKRIKFNKYIKTFLSLSRIRLFKLLTTNQFMNINDLSYWNSVDERKNSYQYSSNKNQKISLSNLSIWQKLQSFQIPIFLPYNKFYETWQFLKICSVTICFFCYLVCFSLNKNIEELFEIGLIVCCQICMILDLFITMNTGIYIKGVLCTNRKEVFNYYIHSKTLYYDTSSIFFTTLHYLIHFNGVQQSRIVMALLLPIILKYNDFNIIMKKIKEKFLLDRKIQNIIELLNLLKNILLISHIFACIWLWVGLTSSDIQLMSSQGQVQPQSWLELMFIQDKSWVIQYLNSYYYITVTMCTVGYGDIKPINPIEVLVSVFLMMICCVIFGFTLNSIGEIFQDFFILEKKIQEKRYIIAHYMKRNYIDQKTRKSIFEYLEKQTCRIQQFNLSIQNIKSQQQVSLSYLKYFFTYFNYPQNKQSILRIKLITEYYFLMIEKKIKKMCGYLKQEETFQF